MTKVVAIAAALLLPALAYVPAQRASAVDTAPSAAALRLSTTLASEANVRRQIVRLLREQTPRTLAADPQFQAIEKQFPGIGAEFVAVMEPIVVEATLARLPEYRRTMAQLFDRRMTPGEVSATADFFASPAGLRVIALMAEGIDYSAMLRQQIATGPDAKLKAGDLTAAVRPAIAPTIAGLTGDEMKQLATFGLSPAGQKMNAMQGEIAQVAAAFSNQRDPAVDRRVQLAVKTLIDRRVAAARGRRR